MATQKKADVPETDNLYDLSDVPKTENSAPARIEKPGILHNLKVKLEMVEGDYKNEEAKAKSKDGKWRGFQTTITDADGLELSEIYFSPPQRVEDVGKFLAKKFELVDGKMMETREATAAETLKIQNNEFLAYLIDLGEAMGHPHNFVQEFLYKNAKGFETLGKAFIDKFKPSENTRISAKVLYNNNKNKETSFLKIHGPYTVYYPYGNDLFDVYQQGRDTILKLSKWESENGMVKMYTNNTDAPSSDAAPVTGGGGFKATVETDEDPF